MNSCNGYFCTVYRAMIDRYSFKEARRGLDSLNEAIYKFGMGKRLGVDFPAERGGNVPTSRYYNRIYTRDKYWYSTNIVSNGIGQGENNLTTIQMANLAATIANRGWFYTPHLIRGAKLPEGGTTPLLKRYTVKHFTGVAAENFDPVVRGMRLVIENGTGSNARINGIPVCGKTGTTQNSHGEDSSVFIGFAPQDDPKIAIAVYLENGGWGNDFAAPITGLMIEKFLSGVIAPNRSALIDFVSNSKLAYTPDRGYYVSKASR
jgi:penicillin-binding protein 2